MKKKRKKFAFGGKPIDIYTPEEMQFDYKRALMKSKAEAEKEMLPYKFIGQTLTQVGASMASQGFGKIAANPEAGSAWQGIASVAQNIPQMYNTYLQTHAFGGEVGNIPVEVEGEEVAETPTGDLLKFKGPNHEQGGIKTDLPEHTQVFSKRLKGEDGKTMAQRKLEREKAEEALSKLLSKSGGNDFLLKASLSRTKEGNKIQEEKDMQFQENFQNQFIDEYAFGGEVEKFGGGTGKDGIRKSFKKIPVYGVKKAYAGGAKQRVIVGHVFVSNKYNGDKIETKLTKKQFEEKPYKDSNVAQVLTASRYYENINNKIEKENKFWKNHKKVPIKYDTDKDFIKRNYIKNIALPNNINLDTLYIDPDNEEEIEKLLKMKSGDFSELETARKAPDINIMAELFNQHNQMPLMGEEYSVLAEGKPNFQQKETSIIPQNAIKTKEDNFTSEAKESLEEKNIVKINKDGTKTPIKTTESKYKSKYQPGWGGLIRDDYFDTFNSDVKEYARMKGIDVNDVTIPMMEADFGVADNHLTTDGKYYVEHHNAFNNWKNKNKNTSIPKMPTRSANTNIPSADEDFLQNIDSFKRGDTWIDPDLGSGNKDKIDWKGAGQFLGANLGNAMSMIGGYNAAKDQLQNVIDAFNDTPKNINHFKDYGQKALHSLENEKGMLNHQRDKALADLLLASNANIQRQHNTARSINTLRALDLASNTQRNITQEGLYEQDLKRRQALAAREQGLLNDIDLKVMSGEQARDLADRQDIDNFYTQKGVALDGINTMWQWQGKNYNDIRRNNMQEKLVNQLGEHFQIDPNTGELVGYDSNGNEIYRKSNKKKGQ